MLLCIILHKNINYKKINGFFNLLTYFLNLSSKVVFIITAKVNYFVLKFFLFINECAYYFKKRLYNKKYFI